MRTISKQGYPRGGTMARGYRYNGAITFNDSGALSGGRFPAECIRACSAIGSVDEAVAEWATRLDLVIALEPIRPRVEQYLLDMGAWGDLHSTDMETLARRVLWLACCEIAECGEWLGVSR